MFEFATSARRRSRFTTARTWPWALVATVALGAGIAPAQAMPPDLTLQFVASLDSQVVDIANTGVAGDDRLFLVRKRGIVHVVDAGSVLPTPFLDIDAAVHTPGSDGDERGLLGLAFHPDYDSNGRFFVSYIDNSGDTVVSRYSVSGDPNVADGGSASAVLTVAQPAGNHNGGQIRFGPDGFLYVGLGDGGGGCDSAGVGCNAQKTDSLLGSMLRVDVDGDDFPGDPGRNYAVPGTNPFVGDAGVLDEIWAYGLRNPWRFSFDRSTGDLYIGDVGQSGGTRREEVNRQPAGAGGQNYGWPVAEGTQCGPGTCGTASCPMPLPSCGSLTDPLYDYTGGGSCSITGGFVYRGSGIPGLVGRYLFGDWCDGMIVALDPGTLDAPVVADVGFGLTTFGEDADGELYAAVGNDVYKLVSAAVDPPSCLAAPTPGCFEAEKISLKLKDKADDAKDQVTWRHKKGTSALVQGDFGDPADGTGAYSLCIYDRTAEVPVLVTFASVVAGTGWKAISTKGYRYKDNAAAQDGIRVVKLKSGDSGKPLVQFKLKGASVPMPTPASGTQFFEQDSAVTVQLLASNGNCWTAEFATARKNSVDEFRAP
jgi:glucose/arabinose dehydrogenase